MKKIFSLIVCILLLCTFSACTEKNKTENAYEQAVQLGYSGTAEELMAALAAENITDEDGNIQESAFEVVQKKGYTGTIEQWYESLGIDLDKINKEK